MAPVSSPRYWDRDELTGRGIVNIISYWPASQRTHWQDARICLEETWTDALNSFDLCYSFKMLCRVEYGGTRQLLALGEELIGELDYEDVEEADLGHPDPEVIQAVAHIPQANAWADVEMQESHSPLGFEPEVSRSGYDVNLVRTNPTELGSTSPVMVREDKMLDGVNSRTPGAGQLGTDENPGHTEDN